MKAAWIGLAVALIIIVAVLSGYLFAGCTSTLTTARWTCFFAIR